MKRNDSVDSVSVIIPTKNSERTLQRCLESITRQTYEHLEILVVDGKSIDNTIKIAEKFCVTIFIIEGERTTAKNFALKRAHGHFLLFLDSDMVLEHTVIEDCVKAIKPENVGVIIIPEKSIGFGYWIRVRDFERSFYYGTKIESARFFRTNDVLAVGGFDEDVMNFEESTVPQKIEKSGLKVDARISSFILHDEGTFNFKNWLRKKQYYSYGAKNYIQRYRDYSKVQMSPSYRAVLFLAGGNWTRLVRHPDLTSGLFILKMLEYIYSKKK